MADQRNRIIKLTEYLESLGIVVNISKTKARGNKGFFISKPNYCRIDIAKDLSESETLSVLIHEFAHFVHYNRDNSLKNLGFIFDDFNDTLHEELIKVAVENVPKKSASKLFEQKFEIKDDIDRLVSTIKLKNPNFKISDVNKFSLSPIIIQIRQRQKIIRAINSKIARLNRYYNEPCELFAGFISMYFTNPALAAKIAPTAFGILQRKINDNEILELTKLNSIMSS